MNQPSHHGTTNRRNFLKTCGQAAACVVALVSGGNVFRALGAAQASQAPAAPLASKGYDWSQHQWGFGIDATRCIGCLRCVDACEAENDVPVPNYRTWVERYVQLEGEPHARIDSQNDPDNITASDGRRRFDNRYRNASVDHAFFLPKLCNQCEHPTCVQVCPVAATYKTEDGVVLIDHKRCIGCGYCVQACPYGARYLNPEKGYSDKCTWCYHRITQGLNPACVEVCPVEARIFGDLNDAQSPIRKFVHDHRIQVLKPETGNGPKVFYVGLDREVK